MIGTVHVMEPADYQAWLSGGGGTGSMSARGEQLFSSSRATPATSRDGTGRGPSLAGVFGSQVKLANGADRDASTRPMSASRFSRRR